jgi:hypothetical protein
MVFRTCTYYLEIVKQSRAVIVDLTNDQGVSIVIWTHICHFEAVKHANAVTVNLWITSRLMASIIIWSHRSRTNKFHWLALIYLVVMILKHHFSMSRLTDGTITIWSHLSRQINFIVSH